MKTRILVSNGTGEVTPVAALQANEPQAGWAWIDVVAGEGDLGELLEMTSSFQIDALALNDAVVEVDLPKLDDFGHHLLVVLHGLCHDDVATYEVDVFLSERYVITVHTNPSPALDALWSELQARPELAKGGSDELVARLADVLTRRLMSVLDAFEDRVEELIEKALSADAELLGDLTAVRVDLAAIRRVAYPQREVLDLLRHSVSPLIGHAGKRRFSDVFDVASRATGGLDAARTALAEILDAYRGAEARQATDVTKVLTIYAAIMLPLSVVGGFFGMNFSNLPGIGSDVGWVIVTGVMVVIAILSLGIFVALGWIRRPSGREAGAALGKGLIEAARAPAQVVGAVYEMSTMPLRAAARLTRGQSDRGPER